MRTSIGRQSRTKLEHTSQRCYWRNAMHVIIHWAKEHEYAEHVYRAAYEYQRPFIKKHTQKANAALYWGKISYN